MLNIRFHSLNQNGVFNTILTMEPQNRSIFIRDFKSKKIKKVWFPHLAFILKYKKIMRGFLWEGQPKQALRILCSPQPFSSLKDVCYPCPTEHHQGGISCLDHSYDNSIFPTIKTLLGTVLDIWWNSTHTLWYSSMSMDWQNWPQMNLEEVCQNLDRPVALGKFIENKGKFLNKQIKFLPSLLNTKMKMQPCYDDDDVFF